MTFSARGAEESCEIISGLIREGQLVALGGAFGQGKTPILQDITVCTINGIPWCGREIEKRPVVAIDFESSGSGYRKNLKNICNRYNVRTPKVPEDLDVYLQNDNA